MPTVVNDPYVSRELIAERRAHGLDRWDEVWEGVYVVMTQSGDEHQELVAGLTSCLYQVIQSTGRGKVRPGVNISDRVDDWRENYRCPDVVVYLDGNPAENHGAFWYGGPDLAIEIVRPGDQTRDELDFYAAIGTRELLVVDRDPWGLELYRLSGSELVLQGRCSIESPQTLVSHSLPLSFLLASGDERPWIQVRQAETSKEWII